MEGDILWDARSPHRLLDANGSRITNPVNGTAVGRWQSTNRDTRVLASVAASYVVDPRVGVRDTSSTGLLTAGFPVFNRTWCLVFTVNSSNLWYWYGTSAVNDVGMMVMVSNGTVRFRGTDNVQRTLAFTPPTYGTPTVVTVQIKQRGTEVVTAAISGTATGVVETVHAGVTLAERTWDFSVAPGTPDLTTHSMRFSAGLLTNTEMETLHANTRASWGI